MLGCMMPMSSPMMKRMLGFPAGCAAAGVIAGSAASMVAPNRAAHSPLCDPSVLPGRAGSEDNVVSCTQSGMTSFSRFWLGRGGSSDAAETEMAGGGVDGLGMASGRSVASAVVRRAQMRAALDDLTCNLHIGRSRVEAVGLAA